MDHIDLRIGEEWAVHLPPGEWTALVEGMTSAVSVRKLWPADPYPEDDDEEDQGPKPTPDLVFMVRGLAPGTATLLFEPGGRAAGRPSREVRVDVAL